MASNCVTQRAEHVSDHFQEVLLHLRGVQTQSHRLIPQFVGNSLGGKGIGRLLVEAVQPPAQLVHVTELKRNVRCISSASSAMRMTDR